MPEAKATIAQNPLCGRLQDKFSTRGIAACNMEKTQRFDRINNTKKENAVRRNANPFETNGEFVRAGSDRKTNAANAKTAQFTRVKPNTNYATSERAQSNASRRTAAYEASTPFSSGAYAAAYTRAAGIRAMAYEGTKTREAAERREAAEAVAREKIFSPAWFRDLSEAVKNPVKNEIKVSNPPVAKGIIIAIVLFAVVVMMIIFSFAQISTFKREISGLSAEKERLEESIVQLSLDADMKSDVREIERIATENIGMVKSNQVESHYISISGGEHVEVCETEEDSEDNYGIFSTMMSAFANNWETIVDYVG